MFPARPQYLQRNRRTIVQGDSTVDVPVPPAAQPLHDAVGAAKLRSGLESFRLLVAHPVMHSTPIRPGARNCAGSVRTLCAGEPEHRCASGRARIAGDDLGTKVVRAVFAASRRSRKGHCHHQEAFVHINSNLLTTLTLSLGLLCGCSPAQSDENDRADSGPGGSGGSGGGQSDASPDGAAGEGGSAGSTPGDAGPDASLPGNGCPADTGYRIRGIVRLSDLHATPKPTGPSVVVKVPCGREASDPTKATCGQGRMLVFVCEAPDCSAPSDPIRSEVQEDGSLQQSSFDSVPFEVCGLDAGTYYVLPIVDHDGTNTLTSYDWTMGVKNLASASVQWPARPHGHEVSVQGDVLLGESLVPTSPDASPVVVDYFHYEHPTPPWHAENAWLFLAASLHPDVSSTGVGIRTLDLSTHVETDHVPSTPPTDALALADPEGQRYEGDLTPIARHGDVAYLATDTQGVILTVRLGADGSVSQGHSIDLRASGISFGSSDVMHGGAVLEAEGKAWLVVANSESAGKPLPHQPQNPLIIVNVDGLAAGDVTTGVAADASVVPDLDKVRFDELAAANGVLYASETGANSRARQTDGLNRLWAITLDSTGQLASHHIYLGEQYNAEGDVPECGSSPPYRRAGLWVGAFQGQTHAFLGNLRTVSVWKFAGDDPAGGVRVQHGSGVNATDMRLDDYALGFSLMRPSPDGKSLFVFGDCKSRWLAVRPQDWAGGAGSRTQSRRRIAVIDLDTADSDGLPSLDLSVGDASTAPDVVRAGLQGQDETLDPDLVRGIGMDCRAVLWNLYDVFGYQHIAGNTFGSDCVINRAADAVVTDRHIFVIGEGSTAFGTTGLGVASELWILDRETGREVLDPGWRWFYEGSSYEERYGYFGATLGERATVETTKGLFLVDK